MSERLTKNTSIEDARTQYLLYLRATKAKSRVTIDKEECSLRRWCNSLRGMPLARITLEDIREHAQERSEEGVTNRTINLDVIMLGNLLRWCREGGILPRAPLETEYWVDLKHTTPKRELIGDDVLEKLCTEAMRLNADGNLRYPNGKFLCDYLKLLAYSGARRSAALKAKWADVSFDRRQITFLTKFDKHVTCDFNAKLEKHLVQMAVERDGTSPFLFPGSVYDHVINPQGLFEQVRANAGLTDICLHDFRHYFVSRAVMAGIDILTIASWVGHADGGQLISKVYGHLDTRHKQAQAAKLSL